MSVDGERICRENSLVVLAVDQMPFDHGGHRFCSLQPLMTLDGESIDASVAAFPNRGRVWWMLRENIRDEEVVPGSIWTATMENATRFDPVSPDSDKYQVCRASIQSDGNDLIEVLYVPIDDPEISVVTRGKRIEWQRRPTTKVFLRGSNSVLGPFKAIWHSGSKDLELQPLSIGDPTVLRVPTGIFEEFSEIKRFNVSLCRFDSHHSVEDVTIHLTRMLWIKLDELQANGELLDASTDKQIVNWALKHYGLAKSKGQPVKAFFSEIGASDVASEEGESKRKLARLSELAIDSERVMSLGEAIAKTISGGPDFRALVESHIDSITSERVDREIEKKRDEIQRAIAEENSQLKAVRSDLKQLNENFERRAKQQDEDLQKRLASRLEGIEEREKTVSERETAFSQKEGEMQARLERLIERLSSEAEKVSDDLLLQLAVLRKIGGLPGVPHPVASTEETIREDQLHLPAFLNTSMQDHSESITEEKTFLRQFERVVERRGFHFSAQDLRNFHTCIKIGGLTVLAGSSGTGKSSLPQLYAEALGWADRYLHVSVRPDWLDDRDFVGAYNPLVRRFEPSNSSVVDRLIAASIDRSRRLGGIYLIGLDEMNLARVEHYFAQFLSVLELPLDRRLIPLFAPGLADQSDPYHPYRELPICDNVRFVGTVNIDETTHFFSPKVLDRSQVVCLPPPDLATLRTASFSEPIAGINAVSLEAYLNWLSPPETSGPTRDFVLGLSELMQSSRLGLRARQFNRVLHYIASARDYLDTDDALDYQIMQVVLPRLRRTAPRFDDTVGKLRDVVVADRFPRSSQLLERIAEPGLENDFFQFL